MLGRRRCWLTVVGKGSGWCLDQEVGMLVGPARVRHERGAVALCAGTREHGRM